MSKRYCTKEMLDEFSKKHYTYINQIFGDLTVREIIMEVFQSVNIFEHEETGAEFENSFHHTVMNTKTGESYCSVRDLLQNINVNKNDTMCQSYSLLAYFDIKTSKNQVRKQMQMIHMYRRMLKNADFIKTLDDIINSRNNKHWRDFTKARTPYLKMNKKAILGKIHEALNEWERYGFWFFVREGNCPTRGQLKWFVKNRAKLTRAKLTPKIILRKTRKMAFDVASAAAPAAAPTSSEWETIRESVSESGSESGSDFSGSLPESLLDAMERASISSKGSVPAAEETESPDSSAETVYVTEETSRQKTRKYRPPRKLQRTLRAMMRK
jgi:hypothetical protein